MSDYDDFDEIEIVNEYFLDELSSSISTGEMDTADDFSVNSTRPRSARRRIEEYFEMRELAQQVRGSDIDIYLFEEEPGFDFEFDASLTDHDAY